MAQSLEIAKEFFPQVIDIAKRQDHYEVLFSEKSGLPRDALSSRNSRAQRCKASIRSLLRPVRHRAKHSHVG
jgi:hypothetical protein